MAHQHCCTGVDTPPVDEMNCIKMQSATICDIKVPGCALRVDCGAHTGTLQYDCLAMHHELYSVEVEERVWREKELH